MTQFEIIFKDRNTVTEKIEILEGADSQSFQNEKDQRRDFNSSLGLERTRQRQCHSHTFLCFHRYVTLFDLVQNQNARSVWLKPLNCSTVYFGRIG